MKNDSQTRKENIDAFLQDLKNNSKGPKINEGLREEAIELYQVITGEMNTIPQDSDLQGFLLDVVTYHKPPVSTEKNCCLKVLMGQGPAERK